MIDESTETAVENGGRSPFQRILRWFSAHPWIGLLASLSSIAGVPLSIVLFFASFSSPMLVFQEQKTRTVVFDAESSGGLKVAYEGQPVARDVAAVQVYLWNSGNEAILQEHVLSPVRIRLGEGARILEAKILKQSRPEIRLKLNHRTSENSAEIEWLVLEEADGGIIQLLYEGSLTDAVIVEGAILGQRGIKAVSPGGVSTFSLGLWIANTFAFLAMAVVELRRWLRGEDKGAGKWLAGMLLLLILVGWSLVFFSYGQTPPF